MSEVLLIATLASILADSAPIIFASLGETLNERAGVVNLSVEGTMMLSAMVAFATAFVLDSYGPMVYLGADLAPYITVGAGFAAAMVAGALIALVVAFGSITLRRDQVAVGFIMTLLATDLSSFAGVGFVRKPGPSVGPLPIPGLADIPVLGPILFSQDAVTYLSFLLIIGMAIFFARTQAGLRLRGIGERPQAAFARGTNVVLMRYVYTLVGGALIGFGGAAFSMHVKLGWSHRHTAGFGWVALAIVIFGGWDPLKVALGAYFFGALRAAATTLQALLPAVPVQVFPLLPFPLMILTLVLFNSDGLVRALSVLPLGLRRFLYGLLRSSPPAALGTHFRQE